MVINRIVGEKRYQQVSEEFKLDCKSDAGKYEKTGKIHVLEDNIDILDNDNLVDFSIEDNCYVKDKFIGTTVAKKITVNIINPNNEINLENKEISTQTGMIINGKEEVVPFGNFIIEKPDSEEVKEKTNFTGYDYMVKFNIPYKNRVAFPVSAANLFIDICDQAGVNAGNTNFVNSDYMILGNPFTNNEDCRTVLSNIAQLAGGFAKIGRDNKAYIKSLKNISDLLKVKDVNAMTVKELNLTIVKMLSSGKDNADETLDGNNYLDDFTKNNKWGEVNSLILRISGTEGENTSIQDEKSISENGLTELVIEDNYFLIDQSEREKVINPLWNSLKGIEYLPFKTTYYGYPYIDSGDLIYVQDTKDIGFISYVFNHTFTFNGGFSGTIETTAMTKTQTAYKNTINNKTKFRQVERKIDKINGVIEDIIEEQTETSNKISQVEQTIDSITQTVSSVETKIEAVEEKADTAQNTANTANSNAQKAQSAAETAQDTANQAVSQIETTTEKVSQIEQTVNGITQSVSNIETKVDTIEDKADNAQSTADNAQTTADNINNNLQQNYYTKTQTNSQIQQTADSINQTIQQNVQETNRISGELEEQSSKITEIEASIEGIEQTVQDIENVTETLTGEKTITLENCAEGNLLELHIYGNNEVFDYLYPSDDLYPADNLYPYGDSRIVVTDEDNNSIIYELGVTDVLRKSGEVYDEYVLKDGKASVIRRINNDGTIKTQETIEELGEYSIKVEEGTNTLTIQNYTANLSVKYAIQNDYTEIFATKVEMNSSITQTAEEINLEVRKKVDADEVVSTINQSAEQITLKSNRLVVESDNFQLSENGNVTCKSATMEDVVCKNFTIKNSTIQEGFIELKSTGGNSSFSVTDTSTDRLNSELSASLLNFNSNLSRNVAQIGVDSASGNGFVSVTGVAECSNLVQTSKKEKKKYIKRTDKKAVELIRKSDICQYQLKGEKPTGYRHYGLVIGENYNCPNEVISESGKGVEIYSMVALAWKAIQEQQEIIENLEKRIKELEEQ